MYLELRTLLFIACICLICAGCTSQQRLASDFRKAKIAYPPKQLALLIFKKSRRMEVYAKNRGPWRFVKSYPVLAASGGPGPKLRQGDRQVPEGIYHITALNPNSHFDLSLKLDYPNAFDRREAKRDHRRSLGNNIFIHGKGRSIGCVAIGDSGIEQLFPLVAKVGISDVTVIIAPDDMRLRPTIFGKVHPVWLLSLYHRITLALQSFPIRTSVEVK